MQDIAQGEVLDDAIAPFEDLGDARPNFTFVGDAVHLVVARSASSGVQAFPARPICPETGAADMEIVTIGPEATLYSFSTVHVSATREVPYTLGYIDFPDGLRALAVIKGDELRCDMPVVLASDGQDWWAEPRA